MKLAKNVDIKKVISRLGDSDNVTDALGTRDVIVSLDWALGDRTDMIDMCLSAYPNSQDYQDVQNDIDNLKDWKRKGVKYVYIDDDIYTTNGKCCLVYQNNLDDVNHWITEYLNGTLDSIN